MVGKILKSAVLLLVLSSSAAMAGVSGKFLGEWKESPDAPTTLTITQDGSFYAIRLVMTNINADKTYKAIEKDNILYRVGPSVGGNENEVPYLKYSNENEIQSADGSLIYHRIK